MLKCICTYTFLLLSIATFSLNAQTEWVDSLYNGMSLDEKIGQLYMVKAYSKGDKVEEQKVLNQIKKYKVGGLCFFQGSPTKQAELTNTYQEATKTPLLISIDGEWGLGMRFKEKAMSFPRQLTLGAIQDNTLIYHMGRHIASQLKRIGIHVNFAPVVDVNNNPDNPVINDRSFGEDKYNVTAKSYAYMKGMQDMGVLACMKHFPGHGDTDVDSHKALPIINHSRARLDSIELVPFKLLVKQGISSAMVAHLHIPAIDNRPNIPTTLSKATVTDILKNELDFNGLIFTDAMEMKGVANYFPDGKADLEAFLAGADVILLPNDLAKGIAELKKAVNDGRITEERLAHSVKKILRAKYTVGLHQKQHIELTGIQKYVNNNHSKALKEELIENAITLVRDNNNLIPIANISNVKISSIGIGQKHPNSTFQQYLNKYTKVNKIFTAKSINKEKQKELLKRTKNDDLVIVSFHDMNKYSSKNFGIDPSSIEFLKELALKKQVIVVLFGSPYALRYFEDMNTVLVAYQENETTERVTAQSLFGANTIKGKLPINAAPSFPYNSGIYRESLGRLGYSVPERVGLSSEMLAEMDEIGEEMVRLKATPGGQVFVAKNGKIVWNKTYGYHTYKKKRPVQTTDIYDVASVTKVCASTLTFMKLYEEGKLDLNASLFRYLPTEVDTSNKKSLNIRDILAHHSRLKAWIPFYKSTVSQSKNPQPLEAYYQKKHSPEFSIKVTDNLYLRNDYRDTIISKIYGSELIDEVKYKYSDMGYYMLRRAVENMTQTTLDKYVEQTFYRPLGLTRTGYLPLYRHDKKEIVPSEKDDYFRCSTIHGYVHDMGCAMMGGVEGHAGLFSTAEELGVIFQMLLNGGSYGGTQYLRPETIQKFTTRYHKSTRRGLGFDMKELDTEKTLNMSEFASAATFGHLGFTGISAFADPEYDLVFILTSNRTFPTMKNNVFGEKNFRPRMQSIVYKSMMNPHPLP